MSEEAAEYNEIRRAIDENPLLRAAERGQRIEQETHGHETVRMLVECAQQDRAAALQALAEATPTDTRAITQAQFNYHVCNAILSYIAQTIERGRSALDEAEAQAAPD